MILLAFETATEACSVALWIDGSVVERFAIAPRQHAELSLPWAGELLAEAGIARSQLDAIAVGRGPGAFTGVRLAIALGQGIALALDRPVVPISTLAALAMRAPTPSTCAVQGLARSPTRAGQESASLPTPAVHGPAPSPAPAGEGRGGGPPGHPILAAIDARMGEVYSAAYVRDGDDVRALSPEAVSTPDAILLPDHASAWHGVGTGFAALDARLQERFRDRLMTVDAEALPHAADIARLAALALARGEGMPADRLEPAYLRDNVALTLAEQAALRAQR